MARLRSGVNGRLRVSGGCGRRHDDARPCGQGRASGAFSGQAAEPSATLEGERDELFLELSDEPDVPEEDDEELDEELDEFEPELESELESELDEEESLEPFEPASPLLAGIEAEEPLRESVR